ncbi:TetR/AcrR family transcriptional regulator [Kitasatospora sp. NPDC001159]
MDAATELFAERGYRQTTFADISERSGISRGSIPWHFGNKEGLLEAVVEQLLDITETRLAASQTGPDGLDRALDRALEFTRLPAARLFITLIAEAVEPGSPLHHRYAELHRALRGAIRTWLAPAVPATHVDPDDLATIVLGTLIGIHQQWRISPEDIDLERVYATVRSVLATVVEQGVSPHQQ